MFLHEAITQVLKEHNYPMTTRELADEINPEKQTSRKVKNRLHYLKFIKELMINHIKIEKHMVR